MLSGGHQAQLVLALLAVTHMATLKAAGSGDRVSTAARSLGVAVGIAGLEAEDLVGVGVGHFFGSTFAGGASFTTTKLC